MVTKINSIINDTISETIVQSETVNNEKFQIFKIVKQEQVKLKWSRNWQKKIGKKKILEIQIKAKKNTWLKKSYGIEMSADLIQIGDNYEENVQKKININIESLLKWESWSTDMR